MAKIWYEPFCTTLLQKMIDWHNDYESGKVFATRDFMTKSGQIIPQPTKYLNKVSFRVIEFKYLSLIMSEILPNSLLTKDINNIYDNMVNRFSNIPVSKNKPVFTVRNEWVLSLAFYKEDIADIIRVLLTARDGVIVSQENKTEELFMAEKNV